MRFTTTVELAGQTATGFAVPDEVDHTPARPAPGRHGDRRRHTYRSTVASMGGRSLVPLSAEHRTASGIAAGDEVEIDLELDTAPRVLEVPDDLAAAIAANGSGHVSDSRPARNRPARAVRRQAANARPGSARSQRSSRSCHVPWRPAVTTS